MPPPQTHLISVQLWWRVPVRITSIPPKEPATVFLLFWLRNFSEGNTVHGQPQVLPGSIRELSQGKHPANGELVVGLSTWLFMESLQEYTLGATEVTSSMRHSLSLSLFFSHFLASLFPLSHSCFLAQSSKDLAFTYIIASYCVKLAKLELCFPEHPSLSGSVLQWPRETVCVRFGGRREAAACVHMCVCMCTWACTHML